MAQYVDVSTSLWGFDAPSLSTRPIKGAFGNDDRDKGKNGLRVVLKNKFLAALYCCGGLQLSDSCPKPKDAPSISGTNGDEDHRGIHFVSDRSDGDDEGEGEGEGGMHRVSAAPHESVSDHDLESGLQATPFPSRVSDDLDSSQTVPATMGKSLQREMRGLEGGNEDSKSVADQNLGWESCLATVSGALGSNLQSEFRRHMMSMPQRDVHARNVDMLERRLMRDISRRRQGQLDAGQAGHADLNGPQASVSSTLLEMKKSTSRNELEKLQGMVKADANGIQNSSLPQRTVSQPPSHRRMESLGIDRSDVQSGRPQGESWVRAGLLSRTFSLLNTKERSVVVDDADTVAQHDDTIISSVSGASGMHSVQGNFDMDRSASLQSR